MKKRSLRRHHRQRVGRNRRKLALQKGHDHLRDASVNALAERHPFDCGHTCFMCHGDKLLDKGARRQKLKREARAEIWIGMDSADPLV